MRPVVMMIVSLFSNAMLAASGFQSVNMNAASKEQLMVLPGVGEKLAQRIIAQREEKGMFASLDDLILIKGVHPKLLQELAGKTEFSKTNRKVKQGTVVESTSKEVRQLTEQELSERLESFKKEPNAREIQEYALKYALAEPSRIDNWLHRARIAPSLPSLSVSAGRGVDNDESVREKIGDASVVSKKDSSDFNLNVKLEWKFADLVFNQNELRVARESFRMSVIRERILTDVTKAYIERRRAQLKSVSTPTMQSLERAELELRIEELDAILDGLTGGWFSEKLANS